MKIEVLIMPVKFSGRCVTKVDFEKTEKRGKYLDT